eukprot:gnl/TRDRNA2_/TRDRNA2_91116_c0_seq1.p1 gnl/TRDRNA2_/TRDRNA2_91116_c0~~gnl/TRDRNA2_/TRDRNA2_91116_c0_seq1.p1  ORF type:complete len:172 (+),score=21.68 gnl/TRDRNA2_/TRDRNA2_91116_c0_seq1:70-585(+)
MCSSSLFAALLVAFGSCTVEAVNCSAIIDPAHCKCSDYPEEMCMQAVDSRIIGHPQHCAFDEPTKKCVEATPCQDREQDQCGCRMTTCKGDCNWDCDYDKCFWDHSKQQCRDAEACATATTWAKCKKLHCHWGLVPLHPFVGFKCQKPIDRSPPKCGCVEPAAPVEESLVV